MKKDEARKLVGGYATGSLTDAERAALFAAALDDQSLFDELAEEQSLKELLDEPGVRNRLIAGLRPKVEKRWSWPWVGVATALAGCAAVAIFGLNMPKPHDTEMTAKVELPSPRTAPAPPHFDELPSVMPVPAGPQPATPPAAASPAIPAPQQGVPTAKDVSPIQPQPQEKRLPNRPVTVGTVGSPEASQSTSNLKDAAAASAEAPVLKAENGQPPPPAKPAPSNFAPQPPPLVAPQAARARAAPASGSIAGVQVQTAPAAPAPFNAADAAKSGFAAGEGGARGGFVQQQTFGFRYQVNDTFLQVTPTSIGWLTVKSGDSVLFANRMVPSSSPLAIPVPADAKELTIQFSGQAGPVGAVPQRRTGLTGVAAGDTEIAITIPARP